MGRVDQDEVERHEYLPKGTREGGRGVKDSDSELEFMRAIYGTQVKNLRPVNEHSRLLE